MFQHARNLPVPLQTPRSLVTMKSKACKNLGPLLEAVSDLARENRKLAKKMEKNSEKISHFFGGNGNE